MSNTPLPEPHGQFLIWVYNAKPDDPVRYRDVWIDDQLHAHAAAVSAAKDARIKVLEDALRMALAELDELPVWSNTGHVCNIARAALGDKTCSG